jgi:hypothetical protein
MFSLTTIGPQGVEVFEAVGTIISVMRRNFEELV